MNLSKLLTILGILIIIFSGYLYWQRTTPQRLSFAIKELPKLTATESAFLSTALNSTPMLFEIMIPAIRLDLPIIPSKITNGNWEATTRGVSYLSSSPTPGTKGNSILYGHDWPNLLGNINKLKPGQLIRIKSTDGKIYDFIVNTTAIVSPNDISILGPSEDTRITLYTCMGFFDDRRFVVSAILK
jgi:LPXTG-site transpeptidase (sortase) family protein